MLSTNYVSTINSQWTKSCQNTQMCIVGKAREAGGKKISGFFGTTLCSSTLYPGTLWCQSIFIMSRTCLNLPTLGLAKRDLWGLRAESWFVVASYAFAKMIPPLHRGAFTSFLSGGFTIMAVMNPPENKLEKRTSVHWRVILAKA